MVVERRMALSCSVRTTSSPREIGSEERFGLCEGRSSSRSERVWVSDGVLSRSELNLIMDLLWMILLLSVVCAEAKNLTVIEVELGQNVTLNCSLNAPSIYWFMEIHSQFRGVIARIYGGTAEDNFYVSTSITKFVAISKTSLMITNVTADDCRLYFCGKKLNDNVSPNETFRIVSVVPVAPPANASEADQQQQQQQHICKICQSELVIFSSFSLNIFLVVVTMGFALTSLCLKRRSCKYWQKNPLPFTCENPETQETPQYEEIQLPSSREPPPAAPPPDCIYYKAQLPQPTQRPR